MKHFERKTNNYWRTLSKKKPKPYIKEVMWWIIKLVLFGLRMVCKLIDLLGGAGTDG